MTPEERGRFIQLALKAVIGIVPHLDFMPIFDVAAEDEDSRRGMVIWRPRADSNRRSPP
jgi:hypothetical protein